MSNGHATEQVAGERGPLKQQSMENNQHGSVSKCGTVC
jgi:hypothetical protein